MIATMHRVAPRLDDFEFNYLTLSLSERERECVCE